jgi:DNA-binding IclR family transcriptional regulator
LNRGWPQQSSCQFSFCVYNNVAYTATVLHNQVRIVAQELWGWHKLTKQPESTLQSVERAIAILKSFSLDKPEWGVSELSREMKLHKSTVSRLLKTLEQGGLLSRNPETERYRLSINLIGLAAQVVNLIDVREVARPWLQQLAETCRETVNLSILDAGQVVNLEQCLPQFHEIKSVSWVGRRMSPHCTAAGKVFLAYLPQTELDLVLQKELEQFTPRTISAPEALRQELARVRELGYAVACEELEAGLNAVATPLYNHRGQVTASLNIAGPAYRVTPEMFPELAARLKDVAAKISEQLGYRQP